MGIRQVHRIAHAPIQGPAAKATIGAVPRVTMVLGWCCGPGTQFGDVLQMCVVKWGI